MIITDNHVIMFFGFWAVVLVVDKLRQWNLRSKMRDAALDAKPAVDKLQYEYGKAKQLAMDEGREYDLGKIDDIRKLEVNVIMITSRFNQIFETQSASVYRYKQFIKELNSMRDKCAELDFSVFQTGNIRTAE